MPVDTLECYALQYLFAVFPPLMRLHRIGYFWINELYFHLVFSGKFNFFVARLFEGMVKRYVHKVIPDPVLADKLVPIYQVGCKRITPSDTYIKVSCPRPFTQCLSSLDKRTGIERTKMEV